MSSHLSPHVRDRIAAFLMIAAFCWLVFVVPIFLLGIGMFGSTIADGLKSTWESATSGDVPSIVMVALTLCLVGLPWALRVILKEA